MSGFYAREKTLTGNDLPLKQREMTVSQATGYRTPDHKTENREGHRTGQDVILRDMDSIPDARNFEVGISVTTMGNSIPKLFKPYAPTLPERIPVFRPGFTSAMAGFT